MGVRIHIFCSLLMLIQNLSASDSGLTCGHEIIQLQGTTGRTDVIFERRGDDLFLESFDGGRRMEMNSDSSLRAIGLGTLNEALIVRVSDGRLVKRIPLSNSVSALSWSPDGKKLAIKTFFEVFPVVYSAPHFDKGIQLQLLPPVEDRRRAGLEDESSITFNSLATTATWSADSRYIGWFGQEKILSVADTETGEFLKFFGTLVLPDYYKSGVSSAKFHSEDPNLLLVAFYDGSHRLVNISDLPARRENIGGLLKGIVNYFKPDLTPALRKNIMPKQLKSSSSGARKALPIWHLFDWSPDGNYLPMIRWISTEPSEGRGTFLNFEFKVLDRSGNTVANHFEKYYSGEPNMPPLPLKRISGLWDTVEKFWILNDDFDDTAFSWNSNDGRFSDHRNFIERGLSRIELRTPAYWPTLQYSGGDSVILDRKNEGELTIILGRKLSSKWNLPMINLVVPGRPDRFNYFSIQNIRFEAITPDGIVALSHRAGHTVHFIYVPLAELSRNLPGPDGRRVITVSH